MDKYLSMRIRRLVGRSPRRDRLLVHVAKRGPLWFFVVLGVLAVTGGRTEWLAVVTSVLAATVTRGVNEIAGRLWFRARPFVQEGFEPLLQHAPTSSFPSNHAACGFALAVGAYLLAPGPLGGLMLGMAVVLAYSRVYVGVHYPADVLLGALIGSGVAWACALLMTKAILPW